MEYSTQCRRSQGEAPVISVLLPVYNERRAIRENLARIDATLERLLGHGRFELLLLNNGSTDGTQGLEFYLNETVPRARLLPVTKKGRGRALNEGYRAARGEIVCVLSIDRAWDESFLRDGVRLLEERADVVFGQKTHPDSSVDRPWKRSCASWVVRWVVSALFGIRPQDTQCVKVFKKSSIPFLNDLHEYNYFAECEFFLRAKREKLRCEKVPVVVHDRRRDSKVEWASFFEFVREALNFRAGHPCRK